MSKLNKVAQITLSFWIMKVLATTLGETAGDMLSMTLDLGYVMGLAITGGFLLVMLVVQLRARRFHPLIYWTVIVGTTTVGTEVSDMLDRTFGLGYTAGSIVLVCGLLAALGVWHLIEGGIKVYPIHHTRAELLYWIAILFSNSLGTAFGDYLSDELGLSYINGALVTAGVIALVWAVHYLPRVNQTALFWLAFIFTRPFGATFGDFLTKPLNKGGLDLGTIPASAVTLLLLAGIVVYTQVQMLRDNKLIDALEPVAIGGDRATGDE